LASSRSTSLMPCFWQPTPKPAVNAKLKVNAKLE
jgi:hypothetical protein